MAGEKASLRFRDQDLHLPRRPLGPGDRLTLVTHTPRNGLTRVMLATEQVATPTP